MILIHLQILLLLISQEQVFINKHQYLVLYLQDNPYNRYISKDKNHQDSLNNLQCMDYIHLNPNLQYNQQHNQQYSYFHKLYKSIRKHMKNIWSNFLHKFHILHCKLNTHNFPLVKDLLHHLRLLQDHLKEIYNIHQNILLNIILHLLL